MTGVALLGASISCRRATSPPPAPLALTLQANWGVGALVPSVWPLSRHAMMTPTVMNLGVPGGLAQIVFVSVENLSDANNDVKGVLRVLNHTGAEISRFPDPNNVTTIPASCGAYSNLNTAPRLSPAAGLVLGKLHPSQPVSIVGVLDDHTTNQGGVIVFHFTGGNLIPQWCSQPLPPGDSIPKVSAPIIAQLDPPGNPASIVVGNKVYDASGNLRYTGFNSSGGNCVNCRTAIVANLLGAGALPQIVTGGAIYQSTSTSAWTGPPAPILLPNVTGMAYPAIADLDLDLKPEIVVTDNANTTLRVFSAAGAQLAWIPLPNGGFVKCGGPPMIGDADGIAGPEIGVASCTNYTVFKYSAGTLSQVWTKSINDPSGGTTSTLFKDPSGVARIYYADSTTLLVFNGANGNLLQSIPNTSATAIEGPIIASFDTGGAQSQSPFAQGRLIVSANNFVFGLGQVGIRIFTDPQIGPARSVWNAHTYHQTNVTNSFGDIPAPEPPSWQPGYNTYRVQRQ